MNRSLRGIVQELSFHGFIRGTKLLSASLPLTLAILLALLVAPALASDDAVPPQVAEINEAIEQQWKDYEIKPAPDVDDATWCRRVYLDLIGRIPTLEE